MRHVLFFFNPMPTKAFNTQFLNFKREKKIKSYVYLKTVYFKLFVSNGFRLKYYLAFTIEAKFFWKTDSGWKLSSFFLILFLYIYILLIYLYF